MNKVPAFFKFFIAERNSTVMQIPVPFMRRLEQPFPEELFLRDRQNNAWTVNVKNVGECWYFVDGWSKFVEDNMLTSGDLMVFKYICDGLLNVKVYGPSATEKIVGLPMLTNAAQQEPISEYNDTDYVDDHNNCVTESDDHDYIFMGRAHDNEDDDDDEDDESEDGDDVLMSRQENEHGDLEQVNNDGAIVGRNTQDRLLYLYPKCYAMEIFQAGLAQQPRNPYFVTKIVPKRRSDLFIPMDVIKDFQLNLAHEIVLVDPSGREFGTRRRKWKDGRSVLSGGWRRLCRLNLVSLEDSCICEFVPRDGDRRLFLHISFVRANMMIDNKHRIKEEGK